MSVSACLCVPVGAHFPGVYWSLSRELILILLKISVNYTWCQPRGVQLCRKYQHTCCFAPNFSSVHLHSCESEFGFSGLCCWIGFCDFHWRFPRKPSVMTDSVYSRLYLTFMWNTFWFHAEQLGLSFKRHRSERVCNKTILIKMACGLNTNLLDWMGLQQRLSHLTQWVCSNRWPVCPNTWTHFTLSFMIKVKYPKYHVSDMSLNVCGLSVTQALWANCLCGRKYAALLALFMQSWYTEAVILTLCLSIFINTKWMN